MTYDYVYPLSPHVTNNNTSLCVYLSWRLSWHVNTLWKCPSPCFTLSLRAPECEHRKQYFFLVCSYFQTNVSHEKYWIILLFADPFVAKCTPSLQKEQILWFVGCVLYLPPFLSLFTFFWFSLKLDTCVFFFWIKLFCRHIVRSWVLTTLIL